MIIISVKADKNYERSADWASDIDHVVLHNGIQVTTVGQSLAYAIIYFYTDTVTFGI